MAPSESRDRCVLGVRKKQIKAELGPASMLMVLASLCALGTHPTAINRNLDRGKLCLGVHILVAGDRLFKHQQRPNLKYIYPTMLCVGNTVRDMERASFSRSKHACVT